MTATAYSPYTPTGRYGLKQVIRAEAVKIATLRSTLWTLLITVAGMTVVTIISTNSVLHKSADWYQGFDPTNQSLAGLLIGILTMGVFGVMVVTGEYASGTIRPSLSAAPRRPLFLAGKVVVAGTGMLVIAEALAFACFTLGQAILSGGGAPSAHFGQPGVARAVIMSGVFLALFGMLGMGLGAIIRNTAGAISAYVGVTFLLPLLLHQLAGDPVRYTPVQILANSVSATVTNHNGQLSPTVGLLLMVAYTAAVLVAGAVMFMQGHVTEAEAKESALRFHLRGRTVTVSTARLDQGRALARTILRQPFQRRTWSELAFFLISGFVAGVGIAFIMATMAAGVLLAVVFAGLLLIAASVAGARGIGAWHRALALHFLDERIGEPDPFLARPGFWGWLRATLTDRAGWRALAYAVVKMPLLLLGVWFGLSVWIEAVLCLLYTLSGTNGGVRGFGPFRNGIGPLPIGPDSSGVLHPELVFLYGVVLVFVAPWAMRLVVYLDRRVMRLLLGPDAVSARVRSLEQSRAQTLDVSAATLRRIERNLHDGTQAQLVALAMRLGQAKEQLRDEDHLDLDQIRLLIDQAHKGAKEAIVELRDLARGIHPPVLDRGLESALATLTARTTVPSELSASIQSRPTPAIEAIAYFCVAELLANVAQHAQASRAAVSCVQHGPWLRITVRDDGRGGAVLTRVGSSSSGLAGLTDRVGAVDGHLSIVSPPGGPTVVTVDLPCRA